MVVGCLKMSVRRLIKPRIRGTTGLSLTRGMIQGFDLGFEFYIVSPMVFSFKVTLIFSLRVYSRSILTMTESRVLIVFWNLKGGRVRVAYFLVPFVTLVTRVDERFSGERTYISELPEVVCGDKNSAATRRGEYRTRFHGSIRSCRENSSLSALLESEKNIGSYATTHPIDPSIENDLASLQSSSKISAIFVKDLKDCSYSDWKKWKTYFMKTRSMHNTFES